MNNFYTNIVVNNYDILRKFLLVILGSIIIGISAHIYIPVYPVPFTMQSLTIMLIGILLGSKLGVYAVLLYILESLIGLPVTASKLMGMSLFTAPSFGYIIGYIFTVYIAGLTKRKSKNIISIIIYLLLSNQIMFFIGVMYLSYFLGSIKQGILLGYLPFILFDSIKVAIAVLSVKFIAKFRNNI